MTITPLVGRGILVVTLAPFLYFAIRDQRLHFSARRVSLVENLLHFAIGGVLMLTIGRAFRFDLPRLALFSALFVLLGAIDEYLFHRGIPETESDVHAKEHFAVLTFLVAAFCVAIAMEGR